MGNCKVCGKPKSKFNLGTKLVCLRCDELLFDLEIECDEETPIEKKPAKTPPATVVVKKQAPATKK